LGGDGKAACRARAGGAGRGRGVAPIDGDLLDRLRALLGARGILTDPADTAPYCEDWRRLYRGRTAAVLRPASTADVAEAVRLCALGGAAIVPQGGNTSMVGGAAVGEDGTEIICNSLNLT